MYLDEGQRGAQQRIAQCDAGVREGPRVDDAEGHRLALGPVHALDELVLGIALEGDQFMSELARQRRAALLDRLEGVRPVYGGLARSEQIEIGAVEQQHSGHGPWALLFTDIQQASRRECTAIRRHWGPSGGEFLQSRRTESIGRWGSLRRGQRSG